MAVKEILLLGNPVLRMRCVKVKKLDDGCRYTIEDLKDARKENPL
jgi:peptide deformylase